MIMSESGRSRMVGSLVATMMIMLMQVQPSLQLPWNHPMRRAVDRVNQIEGPFIGLVMAFGKEEAVLANTTLFTASTFLPYVQIAGRVFNIGTVKGVPTVYVMTGEQITNAAMTIQMLVDTFDIVGVVHYGIAGATNASLTVGDVIVPDYVAYSNSWHWLNKTTAEDEPTLEFGNYNLPTAGNSSLAEIVFNTVEVYTEGTGNQGNLTDLFWIPADASWFELSLNLQDVELSQCYTWNSSEICATVQPKTYFGQKGSSSNVFLANVEFRDFVYNTFNFSFSDEETASIVQTAVSNNKPVVVFRGISDYGGGSTANATSTTSPFSEVEYLAAYNAMKLAVSFIELWGSAGKRIRMA